MTPNVGAWLDAAAIVAVFALASSPVAALTAGDGYVIVTEPGDGFFAAGGIVHGGATVAAVICNFVAPAEALIELTGDPDGGLTATLSYAVQADCVSSADRCAGALEQDGAIRGACDHGAFELRDLSISELSGRTARISFHLEIRGTLADQHVSWGARGHFDGAGTEGS